MIYIFRIKFSSSSMVYHKISSQSTVERLPIERDSMGDMQSRVLRSLLTLQTQPRLFAITGDYYFCKFAPVNLSYLGSGAIYRRDVVYTAHFVGQIALMYGCIAGDWPAIRRVNPLTCIKFVEAMSRNVFGWAAMTGFTREIRRVYAALRNTRVI